MKPNTMFFDEKYSEDYYRTDTVQDYASTADCLIVVGTTLETVMAKGLVRKALEKETPVIECCYPESCIKAGNNI
jgi:NAD-dependent SIR2 family protein deacetylase